jgi:organic radical activating enzyme
LDHVLGNRLRKTLLRSFAKPFCITYHITDRTHINPCGLSRMPLSPCGEAPLSEALTLLRKIRKEVRMLVLAGGEPLLHPTITNVTGTARSLGFEPLVLETNFTLVNEAEEVLKHCHLVVVPLETADGLQQATQWGCDPLWVERIKKNLIHYGARQREFGVRIIVRCIIREEMVDETYDLMEFCFDNNLLFAPTTSSALGLPDQGLGSLPAYERLVDYIVARKKAGAPILGSPESLRMLLAFKSFPCHPTLALHMAPNGVVFYPCLGREEDAGNFLLERTLSSLHRRAEQSMGAWAEDWHDCRLTGYITNTWVLEHFFDKPLDGLARPIE